LADRALRRIAGVGATDARWVGLHVADLARDLGRLLPHRDRVAVALAHLRAVEADELGGLGQQDVGLDEDRLAGAAQVTFEAFPVAGAKRSARCDERPAAVERRGVAAFAVSVPGRLEFLRPVPADLLARRPDELAGVR